MKSEFIGYRAVTGGYIVTVVLTGQQRFILTEDFNAFFVSTGFVAPNALMGGAYVDPEILSEFDLTEEVAPCAAS